MQHIVTQQGKASEGTVVSARRKQRDGGYLLLAILLMMALMIIAATIAAPRVVQQLKRDREEEMIHRGTEYARAIKKFYKKFGRYPSSLEQLENTNQIRFLRKRYKDPLSKDGKWTLLHYGDIQTLLNPNGPGTPAATTGVLTPGGAVVPGVPSPGANSQFGATQSINATGGAFANQNPALSQSSDNSGSTLGLPALSQSTDNSGGAGGGGVQPGSSSFSSGVSQGNGGSNPNQAVGGSVLGQSTGTDASPATQQVFGAGAIVGVASVSKDPTIRIYNKKKKYNEWQFIYNPTADIQNVLLRGPYQPTTIGGAQVGTPAGQLNGQQQGAAGQQQGGFGQQQNSFGQQSSGFGQQPSGFGQQQNTPQQPQPGSNFPPDQNQPQQ